MSTMTLNPNETAVPQQGAPMVMFTIPDISGDGVRDVVMATQPTTPYEAPDAGRVHLYTGLHLDNPGWYSVYAPKRPLSDALHAAQYHRTGDGYLLDLRLQDCNDQAVRHLVVHIPAHELQTVIDHADDPVPTLYGHAEWELMNRLDAAATADPGYTRDLTAPDDK